jgi:hypothetical protein
MSCDLTNTIAIVFTAIGTVAVAILAIWGDPIKDYFLGPRLALSLVDPKGDLTIRNDGKKAYYYHVKVSNQRGRNVAKAVRVVLQGISRRTASGEFVRHPLVYRLPMVWTPMELGEAERTVVDESTCDFGNLVQSGEAFRPCLRGTPNNFRGQVEKDSCVRFELVATGQNVFSPRPAVFEVAWDGQWTENQEEMQRHLVIRKVSSL